MEEETPRSDPFYESFHPQRSERHQGERVKEQGEADQGAVRKRSQDETSHCREGGAQSLERFVDFYVKF